MARQGSRSPDTAAGDERGHHVRSTPDGTSTMGRRIDAFLPLRAWWAIPVAVAFQIAGLALVRTNEDLRWLKVTLILLSFFIALTPVWANRERWGIRIVGLGIVMNLTVMLANGGLMPVAPEARIASGRHAVAPVYELGKMVPTSKDVLLLPEQTNLYWLSDNIVAGSPINKSFSPGDLVILAGMAVVIGEFAVGALRRSSPARLGGRE
ncbi:MAG: DUF5317 domain-containing protein [Chloroflexi bacterium]|nr:DUF5317 domain-containing protein [Chloroflexota bacterium]